MPSGQELARRRTQSESTRGDRRVRLDPGTVEVMQSALAGGRGLGGLQAKPGLARDPPPVVPEPVVVVLAPRTARASSSVSTARWLDPTAGRQ